MNERERRQRREADQRWVKKNAALRSWVNQVALSAGVEPLRLAKTDPEAVGDRLRDLARAVPKS